MIYTSGSTGKPKGTMLRQDGLYNYIVAMTDALGITASDRISLHRPFSFDAHIQDLYPVLTVGGSLHIMPSAIRRDIQGIRHFITSHGITGGSYTTSLGALLTESGPLPLRYITMTGERMAAQVSNDVQLFNGYGPTECTDLVSIYKLECGRVYDNIPIGRPMANGYCFIIDGFGRLLPRGATGELCFAGVQVAAGYWQRPELTAEKFVACPFLSDHTSHPSPHTSHFSKMYRTGDLCRWNADGELEYIGRIDSQVKLRGYRIELGEIESCASRFDGVSQAVAAIRPIGGSDALCLYFTVSDGTAVGNESLKAFLSQELASYMVPTVYMQMDALPLTPSGKVDLRNLPDPTSGTCREYVAPQDKREKVMARLLGDVLTWQEPISMLDNFFSLGGDSIKLIRLVSLLAGEGYTAQVSELMKCSTVREMARTLVSSSDGPAIAQDPVTGAVMPGAIQQRFLSWHLQQPGRYVQSVVFRSRQRVNVAQLEQALQALATHHDMLRATVGDSIVIRSTTDGHLFALQEMTLPSQADAASFIAEAAMRQIEQIDLKQGPILRTVLLHADDGDRLLIVCHHIAIDGVSWRILHEDLTTAMRQLSNNQQISLPRKTHSFAFWTETVGRYRDSHLLAAELPYWQGVQAQMASMALTKHASASTSMLFTALEGESLKSLLTQSAKAYNTEINDLLLTALSQAYHQLTGTNALTIQMEGHGREPLHEPVVTDRTIGWFTSIYPAIIQDITGDLRHDIRHVKEQLRAIPNKGIGYGILQYMGDNRLRTDLTPLVGFNYLGETDKADDGKALWTTESSFFLLQSTTAGELGVPIPSLDINCGIAGGRLVARLEYDPARWTGEQAQQLADTFADKLANIAAHTAGATHTEPTASDFGAAGWSEQQLQSVISHFESRGETLQRVYPLTPMQESILTTYLADVNTTAYRLLYRLEMDTLPTEAALRHTLDYLAAKHEVLRTSILYEDVPQPCQAIVNRRLSLEMRDLTSEPDIDAAASAIHRQVLHRQLSLTDDPMLHLVCMKTGDNSCQLLFAMHHIVIDGWCIPVIFKDFLTQLEAETGSRAMAMATERTGQYEAYVRQLLRRDRRAGLAYWKDLLADYDTRAAIPSYEKPAATTSTEPRIRHTLDKSLTASLRQLAATAGVTLSTVMELGWGLTLQAYCRTEDAVFVKVVSGRDGAYADSSQLVGLFINSVPVRVHTTGAETVRQSLKNLQEQAAQSSSYDFCPLSEILAQTELGTSLFQSIVAYENYPIDDAFWTSLQKGRVKPVQVEEEPFCELSLSISPTPDETLLLTFAYDTSLYGEQQMRQVAETYEAIIRGMATMTDSQLRALPLVTEETQAELTALGGGRRLDLDTDKTYMDYFLQRAAACPDALAVADDTGSLSYSQLDRYSDLIANRLLAAGVQPHDFVGVMTERTRFFPVCVLGIHKAGAAYLPLDPAYPTERLSYMLKDSTTRILVTTHALLHANGPVDGLDIGGLSVGYLDDIDWEGEAAKAKPINRCTPDGYTYIIYTSGSTGQPKGAVLHQKGLLSYIFSTIEELQLTSDDRISSYRSFSFDSHIEDMYPILLLGGSLHIMPERIRKDLHAIYEFIVSHRVTGGGYPTSIAKLLVGTFDLPVRYVSAIGERLTGVVSRTCKIFNFYGPTECTDHISVHCCNGAANTTTSPSGMSSPTTGALS